MAIVKRLVKGSELTFEELDGNFTDLDGRVTTAQQTADTIVVPAIVDNLISVDTTKTLSANQGKVLKGFIDSINTLLTSNDTTLDELQEIVTFIKQNKTTLDSLGISNIAGLQAELDSKVDDGQVLTNVPAGALFTDTIYNDTIIQGEVDLNTAKETN